MKPTPETLLEWVPWLFCVRGRRLSRISTFTFDASSFKMAETLYMLWQFSNSVNVCIEPYTRTREGEAPQLGSGPKSCRVGL